MKITYEKYYLSKKEKGYIARLQDQHTFQGQINAAFNMQIESFGKTKILARNKLLTTLRLALDTQLEFLSKQKMIIPKPLKINLKKKI